jgi:hypothetical protein
MAKGMKPVLQVYKVMIFSRQRGRSIDSQLRFFANNIYKLSHTREMANKTIYLLKFRRTPNQRAHFAIYIHEGTFPGTGILIHVVGAPMAGYQLEIKPDYNLGATQQPYTPFSLGQVPASSVATIRQLAATVRPPGISQNFMAPVDGVSSNGQYGFASSMCLYLLGQQ